MDNPHIESAKGMLAQADEDRRQGTTHQETMRSLLRAHAEAMLAIAVELREIREKGTQ